MKRIDLLTTDAQNRTLVGLHQLGWKVVGQSKGGMVWLEKDGEQCRVSPNGRSVVKMGAVK